MEHEGLKNSSVYEVPRMGSATNILDAAQNASPLKICEVESLPLVPLNLLTSTSIPGMLPFLCLRKVIQFYRARSWVYSLEKTRELCMKAGSPSHHQGCSSSLRFGVTRLSFASLREAAGFLEQFLDETAKVPFWRRYLKEDVIP